MSFGSFSTGSKNSSNAFPSNSDGSMMSLSPGTRIGAYEIVALIGAGGMGEVYRARDTRLKREVAIKILPEVFAQDRDRLTRFQREAELLATLNHSHIGAVYGLEQSADSSAIVLELIDGETLAERLHRGPIGVEEALQLAIQIADALEAAHEKGIIHRDLKPANVKITPDGTVKVLDFGLAKAMETAPSGATLSHSPTLSMMATQAGVILGTAAYMSPEQAKGFSADHRSDIFSFGTVLYEMLTGRQPFKGDTAPDVLASILVREADLSVLPPNLNPRLIELLKRCLEKNPKKRWQAIGDVRVEIETIAGTPLGVVGEPVSARRVLWRWAIPIAVTAVTASALTAAAIRGNGRTIAPPTVVRFPVMLGAGQQFSALSRKNLAISPDGTRLVYAANGRLYLRAMSDLAARPIPGTANLENPYNPIFSPDGQSLAFFANSDNTVKRIPVTGGAAVTLCPAEPTFGMSWDDAIVFGQGPKGIMRVSADGGQPEQIVAVKANELAHAPQILPDGKTVLFTLATGDSIDRWSKAKIVVQSLASGDRKTIIEGGTDARYLPTGHIIYVLDGVLFGIPFDPRHLKATSGPVPVVAGITQTQQFGTGGGQFSVSDTGSLIYAPGPVSSGPQLDIGHFDRGGGGEALKLPSGAFESPRISPDGKRLAFGTNDGKDANIWVYELSGVSAMRRVTFGGRNRCPVWSADGQRLVFQSDREADLGIFSQRADGAGIAERLTQPDKGTAHVPESWSPDGNILLFRTTNGSNVSLWTLSVQGKKAAPFDGVKSAFPTNAVFSPDGRWIAYATKTPVQRSSVYVQPFPPTGAAYQISKSSEDAHHPVWSRDGKEISYIPGPGGQLAVVRIGVSPSFMFTDADIVPMRFINYAPQADVRNYDVGVDGKYVGLIAPGQLQAGTSTAQQIQVVLNWFEELKQRVPVK
jgi:eukaryotic-like serine/threonine-protein kinase